MAKKKDDDLNKVVSFEKYSPEKEEISSIVSPSVDLTNEEKISFDSFFQILMTKNKDQIKEHHKIPILRFFESFGDVNSQTLKWFEDLFRKY